ncbi:hypothetical protein E5676_scaffold702G00080 [Cucumis melo var. makuwa]|uniref:Uncharacterized protein n=1 Tax=Cucumis melo var. makuwa TaxID=1194695 RepID=A0A5D3C8A7_CUCMM|nr:hypothetical protein E5676_scaffold702G00080 [Cucumis melo var. makuwa]
MLSPGVKEVTLEFRSFTASATGANSPLLGWIRLDADLNKNLATFQVRLFSMDCGVTTSFIYGVTYLTGTVSFGIPRLICVCFGIMRLILASDGITRLIDVRVCRGADRRWARRMREGHMDASIFFMLPLTSFYGFVRFTMSLTVSDDLSLVLKARHNKQDKKATKYVSSFKSFLIPSSANNMFSLQDQSRALIFEPSGFWVDLERDTFFLFSCGWLIIAYGPKVPKRNPGANSHLGVVLRGCHAILPLRTNY